MNPFGPFGQFGPPFNQNDGVQNQGNNGGDFNVGLGAGVNPWAFLVLLYMSSRFNAVPQQPQPPVVYIIDNTKK
jgi:hypothetical protein